jgi:N-acetylneuraminate synthase
MLKKIQLPLKAFKELSKHALEKNLTFLSTAFDKESLDYLTEIVKVKILKVPSGEINNFEYLSWVKSKKPNHNIINRCINIYRNNFCI